MDIKQLREQYEAKFNKKPFNGWSAEKLQEMLDDKPLELPDSVSKALELAVEGALSKCFPAVFMDGEPYTIIGNEYIPYADSKKVIYKSVNQYFEQKLKTL